MKFGFRIPDYMIYAAILVVIMLYSNSKSTRNKAPVPPEDVGDLLPADSPYDPSILVNVDAPRSGVGTAFAIDEAGHWLTARHVVDSCDTVGLRIGRTKYLPVKATVSEDFDLAVLSGSWNPDPIRSDLYTPRHLGESGFFFGFPQGRPGEVTGRLLGRGRMKVKGRYRSDEPILAWAENGRSSGLRGSLGGLSGGPVLDKDGEIIGVVSAENLRRGRVYSVIPRNLRPHVKEDKSYKARAINVHSYGLQADEYRRNRQIAQVICLVN